MKDSCCWLIKDNFGFAPWSFLGQCERLLAQRDASHQGQIKALQQDYEAQLQSLRDRASSADAEAARLRQAAEVRPISPLSVGQYLLHSFWLVSPHKKKKKTPTHKLHAVEAKDWETAREELHAYRDLHESQVMLRESHRCGFTSGSETNLRFEVAGVYSKSADRTLLIGRSRKQMSGCCANWMS